MDTDESKTQHENPEQALKYQTARLEERIRGLNCLYQISVIFSNSEKATDEALIEVLRIIPHSFRYSHIVAAGITYEDLRLQSADFRATPWKLRADIKNKNIQTGFIEVYYLEERPEFDACVFLEEEKLLLEMAALEVEKFLARKEADNRLLESEKRYKKLTQAVLSIIWESDAKGKFAVPQHSWQEYTGQTWEEHKDLGWLNAFHPDDREQISAAWKNAVEMRNIFEARGRVIHAASGEYHHFIMRSVPLKDNEGNIIERVGMILDVDKQVKAEESFRKTRERLRMALEAARMGTWEWNIVTNELFWSSEVESIFGLDPGSFSGTYSAYLDLVYPDDLEMTVNTINDCLNNISDEDQYFVQHRTLRQNGEIHWLEANGKVYRDKEGKPLKMAGTVTDITRRKKIEEELKNYKTHLEEMVNERTSELQTLNEKLTSEIIEKKKREEIIIQQAEEIMELSTPVIRIWKGIVIAPLIGTLDSERTGLFMERLLNAVVRTISPIAIIDITGVPTIDTQTAQHLIDAINATKLLGSRVLLTGISPSIAQTLVHLGIDLSEIITKTALSEGLKTALDILGLEISKKTK